MKIPVPPIVCMAALAMVTACKPPPTDADLSRDMPVAEPTSASEPLPSPDTEGALWAWAPGDTEDRVIYGIPNQPALVALACLDKGSTAPRLRITRLAPADEGAEALLALIGNGHIGRIEVEATEVNGRIVWQGELLAADTAWNPFDGPRKVTLTVPGAGMVTLNADIPAWQLLTDCRGEPVIFTPAEEE